MELNEIDFDFTVELHDEHELVDVTTRIIPREDTSDYIEDSAELQHPIHEPKSAHCSLEVNDTEIPLLDINLAHEINESVECRLLSEEQSKHDGQDISMVEEHEQAISKSSSKDNLLQHPEVLDQDLTKSIEVVSHVSMISPTMQLVNEYSVVATDSQSLSEKDLQDLQQTQSQWDAVIAFREEQSYGQNTGKLPEKTRRDMLISYKDALAYFLHNDSSNQLKLVRNEIHRPSYGFLTKIQVLSQSLCCFSYGQPIPKTKELYDEMENLLCIAKTPLDHANEELERMIATVYRSLTGDSVACPSVGAHWDVIGFQGGDPKTDLRAAGMLAILQMLYFISVNQKLFTDIYLLSLNDYQTFPFAVTSVNMTGIVLRLVKDGKFARIVSKNLIDAVNNAYIAIFSEFYRVWKKDQRTIVNFDETKKYLQKYAAANLSALIRRS